MFISGEVCSSNFFHKDEEALLSIVFILFLTKKRGKSENEIHLLKSEENLINSGRGHCNSFSVFCIIIVRNCFPEGKRGASAMRAWSFGVRLLFYITVLLGMFVLIDVLMKGNLPCKNNKSVVLSDDSSDRQ